MNELILTLENLLNIGDNKQKSHGDKVNALLEIERIYLSLGEKEKELYKKQYYLACRNLGNLYHTTNLNSEESILYFEKSYQLLNEGDWDSEINIAISKGLYCKSLILQGLEKEQSDLIIKASTIIKQIYGILKNDTKESIQNEAERLIYLAEHIEMGDVWTEVSFDVPCHIVIENDKKYVFQFEGESCYIKANVLNVNNGNTQNGGVGIYNEKDKYGLLNYTHFTIGYNKFINLQQRSYLTNESKDVLTSVAYGIKILNYFLKAYKLATGRYWIDEINEFMVLNYSSATYIGNIVFKKIAWGSMGIGVTTMFPSLSPDEENNLTKRLETFSEYIWESSYLSAKNQFLIHNYREAIIQINIALENYLFLYAKANLPLIMGETETKLFLNGEIKTKRSKAYGKSKINCKPPTIYKVIEACAPLWISEKIKINLLEKVDSIKKYRNQIVHGVQEHKNFSTGAANAISAFEELKDILDNNI